MKELRKLKPEEIRVRAFPNNGGVKLSLWKVPQANIDVLDDAFDVTERSISYSENGKRCTISLKIDGEWISQDGYAFKGSPDLEPNDALNHAGTAWGIGKELYHVPDMFIYKDKLKGYTTGEDQKPVCTDIFKVSSILYRDGAVDSVTITIYTYDKAYAKMVFKAGALDSTIKQPSDAPTQPLPTVTASVSSAANEQKAVENTNVATEALQNSDSGFSDEEIILIGNCKGKTYGEVKESPVFISFLDWAKRSRTVYDDPAKANQLMRFKALVA